MGSRVGYMKGKGDEIKILETHQRINGTNLAVASYLFLVTYE